MLTLKPLIAIPYTHGQKLIYKVKNKIYTIIFYFILSSVCLEIKNFSATILCQLQRGRMCLLIAEAAENRS